MPVVVTYNRDKLYEELWRETATEVAKRYGVSSNALAKTCKRLNVPMPGRGYWQRRAVGEIDPKPQLPPLRDTAPEFTVARKRQRPRRERIAISLDQGRAAMGPPIIVPAHLDEHHPLVSNALSLLEQVQPHNGLLSCRDERCLDITVSRELLIRTARIMNTLILALEERGMPVEVSDIRQNEVDRDADSNATRVLVNGAWIRFGFVERLRQHRPSTTANPPKGLKGAERELWMHWNRPRMTLVPSGQLLLVVKEPEVGVQSSWCDGRRLLESRLNDFVKQLFVVAEAKSQTLKSDHSWRATFEVEAERNREQRKLAEAEMQRVTELRDALSRWREARDVRQLVGELRSPMNDHAVREWLDWAETYAAKIDPFDLAPR